MASIDPYESAKGRRYLVKYRKPDHRQTTKRGFRTKREAELFVASVELRKANGTYIDPAAGRITVGLLGETWFTTRTHLKPSSIAVMESTWRLHVRPRWEDVNVSDVRFSDVQEWVSELAHGSERKRPKSATLVLRAHGILSSILENAARDRRIDANPARGVSLPRRTAREHIYLSHEQVHRLAEACGEHGTLIRVLAYSGLRWGEASALRAKDVDLARARLTVVQNAVFVKGSIIVGTPKTHKRRSVPIPRFLTPSLVQAIQGKRSEELVFADSAGEYLVTPTIKGQSWYDRALAEAELPPMTIHDLRHTAASLAVSAGANVKAVQKMLGHASAAMTLDVYADLFDDDLNLVGDRLDAAALATDVVKMWSESQRRHESDPDSEPLSLVKQGL